MCQQYIKYLPSKIPLRFIGIEKEGYLEIPQKVELVAANYGVPQRRKRYLIGNFPLPLQTHTGEDSHDLFSANKFKDWVTLGHVLETLNKNNIIAQNKVTDPVYDIRVQPSELTDHNYDASLSKSEARSLFRAKTEHPYMGRLAWPDNRDQAARTVVATQLGRETLIIEDKRGKYSNFRRATVRECASLQSFPITYQFFGSTYSIKYRLVGDAVPPLMSFSIAKQINVLEGIKIECPSVNTKIRIPANQLGIELYKKPKKLNAKRNAKVLLPAKEVRGARVEFSVRDFQNRTAVYKNLEFNLPSWKCTLILGEGAKSTKTFDMESDTSTLLESKLIGDQRLSKRWIACEQAIDKYVEKMPCASEYYGRFIYNIEKKSPISLSEDISKIVGKYFSKVDFDKITLDCSDLFEHEKGRYIRCRLVLGLICGTKLVRKLNPI